MRRLYVIEFTIKGRGNKLYKWERFAIDIYKARSEANRALKREYPQGYRIKRVYLKK